MRYMLLLLILTHNSHPDKRPKLVVACISFLLFASGVLLISNTFYTSLLTSQKLRLISNQIDSLAGQLNSTNLSFTPLISSSFTGVKPINLAETKNIELAVNGLSKTAGRAFYFPSIMYSSQLDSIIYAGLANSVFPLRMAEIEKFNFKFSTGLANPLRDSVHLPFTIVESRVIWNTIACDNNGEPFLEMRNDSLILLNAKRGKPNQEPYRLIYTSSNMAVLDSKGNSILSISKMESQGSSYFLIMGFLLSNSKEVILVAGDEEYMTVHKKAPLNELQSIYERVKVLNPFVFKGGVLEGEAYATFKTQSKLF